MQRNTTVGLDLAKTIFQFHTADDDRTPVFRRKLRRSAVLAFFERFERKRRPHLTLTTAA